MNYTEEQLYGSGILPPAPNTQVVDPFYNYAQSLYPQTSPTPNETSVDSSEILTTPTPAPASVTPDVVSSGLAPGEAVKVKEGEGVSVANSGLNFDTLGKLEKRDPIGKNVAKRMAPIDAELQAQSQIQNQNAANEAQTIQGYTDVGKAQAEIQAKYDVEQSRLVDEHNNNVAVAEEKGRQRIQTAMDQHERLKNEYLTMQVDPGMMWKNMTGGEKAGSGLAVFMSAFLGAKGIDTPVMGLLDKALDRNIDAQLQNINQKGRALDAQGEFVQMVRQQSASDLEAKLRLKDAALESAKYAVSAEMSKYGSKLAELKGQELINGLNKEQLKFRQGIFQERTNIENTITGQEIQAQGDRLQAAQASARLAFDKNNEMYRRGEAEKAKQAAALAEAKKGLVFDTTIGGTEDVWRFRDDITDAQRMKVLEANASKSSMIIILEEARAIKKRMNGGTYSGPNANALRSADEVRLIQLRNAAIQARALAMSGKTLNESEIKMLDESLPMDTWTTNNNFEEAASGFTQIMRESINQDLNTYTDKVDPEFAKQIRASGVGPSIQGRAIGKDATTEGYAPNAGMSANAGVNQYTPEPTRTQEYLSKVQQAASRDDKTAYDPGEVRSTDWLEWAASYNKRDILDNVMFGRDGKSIINNKAPTKAFVEIGNLYDLVKANDAGAAEAMKALETLADETKNTLGARVINKQSGNLDDEDVYTPNATYAQYYIKKLKSEAQGSSFEKDYLKEPDAWYGDLKDK